jgi:hypothetical protein
MAKVIRPSAPRGSVNVAIANRRPLISIAPATQPVVQGAVTAAVFRAQRQIDQGSDRTRRAQHRVGQLEQRVRPRRQTVAKPGTERLQIGKLYTFLTGLHQLADGITDQTTPLMPAPAPARQWALSPRQSLTPDSREMAALTATVVGDTQAEVPTVGQVSRTRHADQAQNAGPAQTEVSGSSDRSNSIWNLRVVRDVYECATGRDRAQAPDQRARAGISSPVQDGKVRPSARLYARTRL